MVCDTKSGAMIPTVTKPILRREFSALMDAEATTRRARRLLSSENPAPAHERRAGALDLIDHAIAQLVAARALIDPAPEQEKSNG